MDDRGQIEGVIVDGPLAFDNAISKEADRIKGVRSPASDADVTVVRIVDRAVAASLKLLIQFIQNHVRQKR